MKGCVDEGVLQAYADGELPAGRAAALAAHLAACAACAAAAREAAAESAALNALFAVEEPLSVPTDRLRSRIAAAIAEAEGARASVSQLNEAAGAANAGRVGRESFARDAEGRDSIGTRLRALVSSLAAGLLAPRGAAAFAGLALAALLAGAIYYTLRPGGQTQGGELARDKQSPAQTNQAPTRAANQSQTSNQSQAANQSQAEGTNRPALVAPSPESDESQESDELAKGGAQKKGFVIAKQQPKGGPRLDRADASAATAAANGAAKARTPADALLPVEREYQTEIASLKSAIERKGAVALSPTLRAEYERSLAVVEQAIAASRQAARSNPQDTDAQEFLRTAYRDKLDLLSAVADRAQVAGLER